MDMDSKFTPLYPKEAFLGTNGHFLTRALFRETNVKEDGPEPLYCLGDREKDNLPSLKRLYLEMEDLAEHTFASTHLHSYDHFLKLLETSFFQEAIAQWRAELELKVVSKALKALQMEAEGNTAQSFQANKYLASGEWKKKIKAANASPEIPKNLVGRPSKDLVHRQVMELAKKEYKVSKDFERIFNLASEDKTSEPN